MQSRNEILSSRLSYFHIKEYSKPLPVSSILFQLIFLSFAYKYMFIKIYIRKESHEIFLIKLISVNRKIKGYKFNFTSTCFTNYNHLKTGSFLLSILRFELAYVTHIKKLKCCSKACFISCL